MHPYRSNACIKCAGLAGLLAGRLTLTVQKVEQSDWLAIGVQSSGSDKDFSMTADGFGTDLVAAWAGLLRLCLFNL